MVTQEMHPKETEKNDDESTIEDEEMEEEEDYEHMTEEEFTAINSQLDELSSALDDMEQKNDDIHAQLLVLLEANRAVRKQMQEQTGTTKESSKNE